MTGLEAALQEEHDKLVRRRREIRQAEEDEGFRLQYREEAVGRINARHSQEQQSFHLPPSSPSISASVSDSDPGKAVETAEAPRPKQGVQRTQKLVDNSQIVKELAAWRGKAPTKRKPGKKALAAAAAEMSQLLDGYLPPPSSAALFRQIVR